MDTVHGLEVNLGIPIRVIEDDMVGLHQIKTQATGSSTEEEEKDF